MSIDGGGNTGWIGWIVAVAGFLGRLFGAAGAELEHLVRQLGEAVKEIAQRAVEGLMKLGFWMKQVGALFKKFWTNILKPALQSFVKFVKDLSAKLKKWFDPLVKRLLKLRKWVLHIYDTWVKPIINALNIASRILEMLSKLGVPWAKTVEQKIQKLEAKIEQPFLDLVNYINKALDWINRIVTLDGLLQKVMLLESLFTYRRDYYNFHIRGLSRPLRPIEKAEYDLEPDLTTADDTVRSFGDVLSDPDNSGTPAQREWAGDFLRIVRDGGDDGREEMRPAA